jgi:uncharacterized protein YfcZ (UPF0381/DUF406 family)
VQFVIGEETFSDQATAMAKLADLLEREAEKLASMQFAAGGECVRCPMHAQEIAKKNNSTMMYRVGGFDFAEQAKAEQALRALKEKAAQVRMECKVGAEMKECNNVSDKNPAEVTYVVAGEETPCKITARLMMIQEKIRTMVETAAAIQAA